MGGKFYKRTIRKVSLDGETVLLRADYNVPLTSDGEISDDFRIRSSLPTLRALIGRRCKIVIISHLGRPDGVSNKAYGLEPVAVRLAELLGKDVRFVSTCVGERARMAVKRAPKSSVILLENLRFHPGEETNDMEFARQIAQASGASYFVQDGFGVVHRAHASTSAIAQLLPSVAGLLLEREFVTITDTMRSPVRPLVAVMGGAKVSDKISFIKELVHVADKIIVGGAMANTFLAYEGNAMGKSKYEPDMRDAIEEIYAAIDGKVGAENRATFLQLPVDLALGKSTDKTATSQIADIANIPSDAMSLDIGPRSIAAMLESVYQAKTVIWNGTLGYAEVPVFAKASQALAGALAGNKDIASIIGGGDTADFVIHWDVKKGDSFTHVSTGGGASLELMSGLKLPGVEALLDA